METQNRQNKISLLYLTAAEDSVNQPVIRSQVFKLLEQFKGQHDLRIIFLSFIPFRFYFELNHPIRSFKQTKKKRAEFKSQFRNANITIRFLPFVFPFRRKYFHMKLLHLTLFLCQTFPVLLYHLVRHRVDIIQARSYPACLLSYFSNKLLSIKYIFEMRGIYPDEGVVYGAFARTSQAYRRWKRYEAKMIRSAYAIVIESRPFKDYVEAIHRHDNISIIPCYVDDQYFRFDETHKKSLRKELGLENRFIVTYCGTIGGWHDPGVQADYFIEIRKQIQNAYFLILTFEQKHELVKTILQEKGISKDDYWLLSPSDDEIPKYLNMGDVGLLVIANLPTAKKAVSIKFSEYLASGLPVVCTPYVAGAAELIHEHRCGIVVDLATKNSFSAIQRLLDHYEELQANGLNLVRNYLSVNVNSSKFLQIYHGAVDASQVSPKSRRGHPQKQEI